MRWAFASLAFAAAVKAVPQAVSSPVPPSSPAPAGCQASYSGSFEITVINVTTNAKRGLSKRDDLILTLNDGILKDHQARTGYIASNSQFQFDAPPQAGAIYTAGFSVCPNGSLALGGSAIWYQCYSGGFYNLYNSDWAPQCSPIYMVAIAGGSGSPASGSASGTATQGTDGQPGQGTAATTVPQRSDGQPYATVIPVSQLSDGQPQGPASAPNAGRPVVTSQPPPVSTKSEGQPVATSTPPVVSIAPEGQPQVTTQAQSNGTGTGRAAPPKFTGGAAHLPITGAAIAAIAGIIGVVALL